jgi:PhnB protein
MPVNPIPKGFEGATPYLCCKDAAKVLEFYKAAFGASELYRLDMPDGRVGHAEIKIGSAVVMLADEFPEWGIQSPLSVGGASMSTMIYVEDVDAFVAHAEKAGAKVLMKPETMFYGDRASKLEDPSGHLWMFSTRVEDLTAEEINERAKSAFTADGGCGTEKN